MNRNHRISVVPALLVLLAAHVPAQAGRQVTPTVKGAASGPLDARKLCDIGAKSQFQDPVTHGVPAWEAEQSACYGNRQLSGEARDVTLIVHGTGASDPAMKNTIQIFFTAAGESEMVQLADLKAVAIPLLSAFFLAAGEEAPADLLRDVGASVEGRLGTARVRVDTALGIGYYRITIYFPGRTIR